MAIVKKFHSKETNMWVQNLLYHVAMMREQEYHPTELHVTQDEKRSLCANSINIW